MEIEYEESASKFAEKHGIKLRAIGTPEYKKYFPEDRLPRYVFKLCLSRHEKQYIFSFGQSHSDGNKTPTMYDVLASLTKNDPGTFEQFCANYGYDTDSCTAERIYDARLKEYDNVKRLFGDLLEDEEFQNIL
jgi:hypothetical protein